MEELLRQSFMCEENTLHFCQQYCTTSQRPTSHNTYLQARYFETSISMFWPAHQFVGAYELLTSQVIDGSVSSFKLVLHPPIWKVCWPVEKVKWWSSMNLTTVVYRVHMKPPWFIRFIRTSLNKLQSSTSFDKSKSKFLKDTFISKPDEA